MAVIENRFVCDLSKPVQAQALKGNVFSLDNLGSRLSVLVYDNGQPATISGSVTANCILPDGSTVNVNGGLTTEGDGSKAYVDVPQSCLLIPGILKIAIKCTSSSVITTLAAIVANVYMTKTDNVITPSQQIITDWSQQIAAEMQAVEDASAAQDAKIDDLKISLNGYTGIQRVTMTYEKVINLNVSSIDFSNITYVDRAGCSCAVISVNKGDKITITAEGVGNYRAWGHFKSDGTKLGIAASGESVTNFVKEASNDGYIVINDAQGRDLSFYGISIESQIANIEQDISDITDEVGGNTERISEISDEVDSNAAHITVIDSQINAETGADFLPVQKNKALNVNVSNIDFADIPYSSATGYTCVVVECDKDDVFTITAKGYGNYRAWAFFDSSGDRLGMASSGEEATNLEKTAPADGYLVVNDKDGRQLSISGKHLIKKVIELQDEQKGNVVFSKNAFSKTGTSLAANTKVELDYANIHKNVIYELCCKFGSFNSVTIGQGESGTKYASWVTVDATNITTYLDLADGNPRTSVFAHGLTIADFLYVRIKTTDAYNCVVEIQTKKTENDTGIYATEISSSKPSRFYGNCFGKYNFISTAAISEYTFSVIFRDATKPIWLFGDSYLSFTNDRWVYYLKDFNQLDNVLVNACGGLNSLRTTYALNALKGKPKFALWEVGMNDNEDSGTTPAVNWSVYLQTFLAWCEENNCTPILATIPSIPSKNHAGKNAYIRSSGYRYVDLAAAVSPNDSGTWYPGMIEDGNSPTHPSVLGAKAMFHRVLADFPEIMGDL